MENSSNTIPKQLIGKGFKKGDPRINRKGRPKSFDTFRALALCIANRSTTAALHRIGLNDDKIPEKLKKVSVAEYILSKWAFSGEPVLQKAFTEVAFGKIPIPIEHGGNGEPIRILIEYASKEKGKA